jgi:hypothetical protein
MELGNVGEGIKELVSMLGKVIAIRENDDETLDSIVYVFTKFPANRTLEHVKSILEDIQKKAITADKFGYEKNVPFRMILEDMIHKTKQNSAAIILDITNGTLRRTLLTEIINAKRIVDPEDHFQFNVSDRSNEIVRKQALSDVDGVTVGLRINDLSQVGYHLRNIQYLYHALQSQDILEQWNRSIESVEEKAAESRRNLLQKLEITLRTDGLNDSHLDFLNNTFQVFDYLQEMRKELNLAFTTSIDCSLSLLN